MLMNIIIIPKFFMYYIHVSCHDGTCHRASCKNKICSEKYEGCCSVECKEIAGLPMEQQRELRKNVIVAAPLKQYQKSIKPRLKDLIKERAKVTQTTQ